VKTISQLLKNGDVAKNLFENILKRKANDKIVDKSVMTMFDGVCYKNLNLGNNDITCTLNSDGIPLFKSSKVSLWPLLYTVNELDYNISRKNVLCLGIWFGNEKPNFSCFLNPFIKPAINIASNGIDWKHEDNTINSKVFFPLLVADSVARPMLQGLKQFNGSYGCTWCLLKGQSLTSNTNVKSRSWIYPPVSLRDIELRTKAQFIGHLRKLEEMLQFSKKTECCFGIKLASKLILFPKFDIVNGFVFDYMHTCLLGISRTFTNMWLDSKNHSQPYYIGLNSSLIDSKLFLYFSTK